MVEPVDHRYGNKRIGFLAIVTFIGVSDHDSSATEAELVTQILALAGGRVSEEALADRFHRIPAGKNHLQAVVVLRGSRRSNSAPAVNHRLRVRSAQREERIRISIDVQITRRPQVGEPRVQLFVERE